MGDFNPFADDDEPKEVDAIDETPKKRGRPVGSGKKAVLSREATKHVGGNFPTQVSTELARVCIDREEKTGVKHTIQGVLAEAINAFLRKEGRPPIAREK